MDLERMRKQIDEIDQEVLRLIGQRFELAIRTKRLKSDTHDESREQVVKLNARESAKFLLNPDFCESLLSSIMNESKRIQDNKSKLIGFVGIHGSLAEQAILDNIESNRDNSSIPFSIPCSSYKEVIDGVKNGVLDSAIIPYDRVIEESSENPLYSFLESGLVITAVKNVAIDYGLLTLPTTDYRDIKIVYSHPEILLRAEDFISRTKLQSTPYHGSAEAALMLSTQKPQAAAVLAPTKCASTYKLSVVKAEIFSDIKYQSRYIEISNTNTNTGTTGVLYFGVTQKPGSLNAVLDSFAANGINLSKLESLSNTDQQVANFLVEFDISIENKKMDQFLDQLSNLTAHSRLLGKF
jgi:prephenate dehydratase/chorismate mutase